MNDLHVSVSLLTLIGGFLPLLVPFVVKQSASVTVKTIVHLLLTAVAAVVTKSLANKGIVTQQTLLDAGGAFVTGLAVYYRIWKPKGVAQAVANVAPDKGVG